MAIEVWTYNGLSINVAAFYLMDTSRLIKDVDAEHKKLIRSAKGWVSGNMYFTTSVPDKYKELVIKLRYTITEVDVFNMDYEFNIV